MNSTILFLQLCYWHSKMSYAPFYKYLIGGNTDQYINGISLCKELGMGEAQIKKARNNIASRIKNEGIYSLADLNLVLYWRAFPNKTFYFINYVAMLKADEEFHLFEQLFPHFADWKKDFLNSDNRFSEMRFSLPTRQVFPQPYIKEIKTEDQPEDRAEEAFLNSYLKNKSNSFLNAWNQWCTYEVKKYKKIPSITEKLMLLKMIEGYDDEFVIRIIKDAILKKYKHFHFEDTVERYQKYKKAKNEKQRNYESRSGEKFDENTSKIFDKYK